MQELATPDAVVAFWREAGPERWFKSDLSFDEACRSRFLPAYEAAAQGDLNEWELTASGALAVVLLLDQFPRNMFRGARRAYATDQTALLAADRAIERGHDAEMEPALRRFFYLPFMHSEELRHQDRAVTLNEALGDTETVHWARHHRDVIARFGRFPHRNAILGRDGTAEEAAFLAESKFRG